MRGGVPLPLVFGRDSRLVLRSLPEPRAGILRMGTKKSKAKPKAGPKGGPAKKAGKSKASKKGEGGRRSGLRGAAPWAARHAAKHAAEARARNASPAPPGSARATLRTPEAADEIKAKVSELHNTLVRI